MKFTILSHAGLLVEHAGSQLICDPWLFGSCYWRSWWNLPEPDPALIAGLKPDYVYLTHLHWDHFHGPSLRRFDRNTAMLVPKLPTRRMVTDLHYLGFRNVVEIPHGGSVELTKGLKVWSYQFGLSSDSALVISNGNTTILNANDCKLFGSTFRSILLRHRPIDFLLRSHSSASALPYCIDTFPDEFSDYRSPQDYVDEFARFAVFTAPRYAIPFASNHCYLHKETRRFNAYTVSPELVKQTTNEQAKKHNIATRCEVMPSGSSWSEEKGFDIHPFDYNKRLAYIDSLADKHAAKLEACYAKEAATTPDFIAFKAYFEPMLAVASSWLTRTRDMIFLFRLRHGEQTTYWLFDFIASEVRDFGDSPPEAILKSAIIIDSQAAIINDCCKQQMFSTWTASKRLRVHLPSKDHIKALNRLFTVLDLYELGTLPLAKNFMPRSLGVRARRWREVMDAAYLVRKVRSKKGFKVIDLYPV